MINASNWFTDGKNVSNLKVQVVTHGLVHRTNKLKATNYLEKIWKEFVDRNVNEVKN